jgi:hypothetical protein
MSVGSVSPRELPPGFKIPLKSFLLLVLVNNSSTAGYTVWLLYEQNRVNVYN